mgnify:CR=1 FL=1
MEHGTVTRLLFNVCIKGCIHNHPNPRALKHIVGVDSGESQCRDLKARLLEAIVTRTYDFTQVRAPSKR